MSLSGSDRLPAGRAARSGEPEEGPGEADQDAGVRPQTGEVSLVVPYCSGLLVFWQATFNTMNHEKLL